MKFFIPEYFCVGNFWCPFSKKNHQGFSLIDPCLEDDFAMVLLEDANEKIYLTEEKLSGPVRGSQNPRKSWMILSVPGNLRKKWWWNRRGRLLQIRSQVMFSNETYIE